MDTQCKQQINADKLTLQWLGTPNIEINGQAIRLETQKAVALLAYLSLANQPVPREALAAMFWPEFDQSHAFANLRRNLASLDKSLGYCWIDANRSTISFRKSENLFIDIVSYFDLIKRTKQHCRSSQTPCKECLNRLEQAANLYRDEFLSCLNFKNCNNFDEWQYFQREEASLELAIVLRRLSEGYAAIGNIEQSIRYARRWVKLDRLNEEAQRFLIHLYSQAGQRGTALRQYDEFLRLLTEELGQAPEPETVAMYEKICIGRPTPKNAFSFGIPVAFSNGAPEPLHGACSALTMQHFRLAHQDPMP
jgi:DNA-binding SARP family transcriptional activator